jgi:hypothetical protein
MKVNKYILPIGAIIVLFATVLAAQAAGVWQVTGSTTIIPTTASGRPDPEAIKGKMTLDEIIAGYKIPQADLYAALELPADLPASTQIKELESVIPDFEVDLVRQAVQDYYDAHP